jgi:hypothetical protein
MPFFSIIALTAFLITFLTIRMAIRGNHKHYWTAAIACYIFSFIAGFSIGQVTVGFTFVLLVLAIGYTLRLIRNKSQLITIFSFGLLVGIIMVIYIDDYWLFYPLTLFI